MYNVLTLNSISEVGLSKLNPKKYIIGDDIKDPEGIILRSYDMHEMELPESLAAVASDYFAREELAVANAVPTALPVGHYSARREHTAPPLAMPGAGLNC